MIKIIGLMIVKDEADILKDCLDSAAKWLDGVFVVDNGSVDDTRKIIAKHSIIMGVVDFNREFDESVIVPLLHSMVKNENIDWFVDLDADEFYSENARNIVTNCPNEFNVISVNIRYMLKNINYRSHLYWPRIYRNQKFDYSELQKLHGGKIPILKSKRNIFKSDIDVFHYQIRSYEQGMRKFENYKRLDTNKFQNSYEHIREIAKLFTPSSLFPAAGAPVQSYSEKGEGA